MRKNILFFTVLAAAGLFAASCNKDIDRVAPKAPEAGIRLASNAIYFSAGAASRSTVDADASSVQSHGFAVAAAAFDGTPAYYSTYFNRWASYNAGNSVYLTPDVYYYPNSGTLSFFAASMNGNATTMEAFDAKNEAGKLSDIAIAISGEGAATLPWSFSANDERDLIAAKAEGIAAQSSAQALVFDHVTSQLAFTAVGTDANVSYKIKKIGVVSPNSGTYAYAGSSWTRGNELAANYAACAADAAKYAETIFVGSDLACSTASAQAIDGSFSFIPGAVKVIIEWECWKDDVLVGSYSRENAATGISLQQGKKTTINLSLPNDKAKQIKFTISVNAWGTASQDITMTPAEGGEI